MFEKTSLEDGLTLMPRFIWKLRLACFPFVHFLQWIHQKLWVHHNSNRAHGVFFIKRYNCTIAVNVINFMGVYLLYWWLYCVTPFCRWYNPLIKSDRSQFQTKVSKVVRVAERPATNFPLSKQRVNDQRTQLRIFLLHALPKLFSQLIDDQQCSPSITVSPPANLPHYSMSPHPHCKPMLRQSLFSHLIVFTEMDRTLNVFCDIVWLLGYCNCGIHLVLDMISVQIQLAISLSLFFPIYEALNLLHPQKCSFSTHRCWWMHFK